LCVCVCVCVCARARARGEVLWRGPHGTKESPCVSDAACYQCVCACPKCCRVRVCRPCVCALVCCARNVWGWGMVVCVCGAGVRCV
jgi:hypothetical protein